MESLLHFAEQGRQVQRAASEVVASGEQASAVAGRQGVEQRTHFVAPGDAEHVVHARCDDGAATVGYGLIGDGEGIAHAASGGAGDGA